MIARRWLALAVATNTSVVAHPQIRAHALSAMMTRVGTVRAARAAQGTGVLRETARLTSAVPILAMTASIYLVAPPQAPDPVLRAMRRMAWGARAARVVPARRVIALL